MFTPTSPRTLASATVAALLLGATALSAAPFVYLPVGGAGKIEVIDVATAKIIDTYTGLKAVHGLAGTPDGKYLVAGSFSERPVSANDANGPQVSTVSVLDQATGKLVATIDVPGAVHHVTISPDGRFAALTQPAYASVSIVDLKTLGLLTTIKTGAMPNYMVFSPDSAALYVSNAGNDTVVDVTTNDWKIAKTFKAGQAPEHMVISADGKTLYVNNNDDGTVSAIDTATGKTDAVYPIGERLHGIDLSNDGKSLLVAERDGNNIAKIDLASGTVSKQATGPAPYHLTSIPGTDMAYVTSSDGPVLRVIKQSDMSAVTEIKIPAIGHQMVVSATR